MVIRLARPEDIPALIRLLRQVGEVHHKIRPDIFRGGAQKYDESALLELLKDESRPVFVAEEGNFVQGYCFCVHKTFGGSACTDRKELYIDDLCVEEGCRGQGIATALYRHACGYAKERGCGFVTLNVWSGNDGAMAFYEKVGMRSRSVTMETPL